MAVPYVLQVSNWFHTKHLLHQLVLKADAFNEAIKKNLQSKEYIKFYSVFKILYLLGLHNI